MAQRGIVRATRKLLPTEWLEHFELPCLEDLVNRNPLP